MVAMSRVWLLFPSRTRLTAIKCKGMLLNNNETLKLKIDKLKIEIKSWERNYEKSHGRKALKADLKQHPEIYKKYKKYQIYRGREKQLHLTSSSDVASSSPPSEKIQNIAKEKFVAGFKDNAAVKTPTSSPQKTPLKRTLPNEIGPTPQLEGRSMGIFDLLTPRKFASVQKSNGHETPSFRTNKISTPVKTPTSTTKLLETPLSAISDSLNYMQSVIPCESESPLAPRKAVRSISALLADLNNLPEVDPERENEYRSQRVEIDDDFLGESKVSDDELDVAGNPKFVKKGLKRQNKRVILKPVGVETGRSRPSKPQENFKRLKLHNSGHKGPRRPFGRRR